MKRASLASHHSANCGSSSASGLALPVHLPGRTAKAGRPLSYLAAEGQLRTRQQQHAPAAYPQLRLRSERFRTGSKPGQRPWRQPQREATTTEEDHYSPILEQGPGQAVPAPRSAASAAWRQLGPSFLTAAWGLPTPAPPTPFPPVNPAASPDSSLDWTFDEEAEAEDSAALRLVEQSRLTRQRTQQAALPPKPTVITRLPEHLAQPVLRNALLLLDKPADWSSEEVTRALRWSLKLPRQGQDCQVGYVGSLEPGASGLMVLLMGKVGKATALARLVRATPTRYTGLVRLGTSTDTYDSRGKVTSQAPTSHITDAAIAEVATRFTGEGVQVPPLITAIKLRGRPVYELTRKRPSKQLQPQAVHISHLHLSRAEPGSRDLQLDVTFSRTGFPRSLAHDIGLALGCGAHLAQLRRESVGGFSVDDAWTLDAFMPAARKFAKNK
ncbi:pseudouridine synthase [Haematococcus lacustris]